MFKMPISILQELMVQRKQNIPNYHIENNDAQDVVPSFGCTVKAGAVRATGFGPTKKDAKQNSATKALEKLGFYNNISHKQIPVQKSDPFINYVGKLNDLASTNHKSYPVYHDLPMASDTTFVTRCKFLNFHSKGYGSRKTDAKQDAARNMLKKLKNADLSAITVGMQNINLQNEKKRENLNSSYRKYDKLSVDHSSVTTLVNILPTKSKKSVTSLKELENELKKYGYKYRMENFQSNPYIMTMILSDTGAIIMGKRDTKEKALNDLFVNALLMFNTLFH